jgi:hypothetical protein
MRSLTRLMAVELIVLINMSVPVKGQNSTQIEPEAMRALTEMGEYLRTLSGLRGRDEQRNHSGR